MIAQDNGAGGGEDDSSTERDGEDSHLHEDQKSPATHSTGEDESSTKVQDLAKAGRDDFDPNEGQE